MTTKSTHHLPGILSVLLLVAFALSPAWAGTTDISFENDVGLLTDQTPPGFLTTPPGDPKHGIFSGAGYVYLYDAGARIDTNSPNSVSVTIRINPAADAGTGLHMFIADRDFPLDSVLASFSSSSPTFVTLNSADGSFVNLDNSFAPNAAQDFTLTYDIVTERATLFSQTDGPVFRDIALKGAQNVVIGIVTDGAAVVRTFSATGVDIPDYPSVGDPLIPSNPWVDFSLTDTGNGAQTNPFKTLAEALAAAAPDATVSIVPGVDSTETFTEAGGSEISQSVTLANSDFASGSVSIGVPTRSPSPEEEQRTGFISKGPSPNR